MPRMMLQSVVAPLAAHVFDTEPELRVRDCFAALIHQNPVASVSVLRTNLGQPWVAGKRHHRR
jgi:hypothetical protein